MHSRTEPEMSSKCKRHLKAERALELFRTKPWVGELAKASIRNKSRSMGFTHLIQDTSTDKRLKDVLFRAEHMNLAVTCGPFSLHPQALGYRCQGVKDNQCGQDSHPTASQPTQRLRSRPGNSVSSVHC